MGLETGAVNKSPIVRLHISLTGDLDTPQEVIRKVTEGENESEAQLRCVFCQRQLLVDPVSNKHVVEAFVVFITTK